VALEKQLELLQAAEASIGGTGGAAGGGAGGGGGGGAGAAGDRIRQLQQDAGALAKDTGGILNSLAGN